MSIRKIDNAPAGLKACATGLRCIEGRQRDMCM